MTDTTTYTIPALTGLFGRAPLARDGDEVRVRLFETAELDALARSGDCFVTIASRLDAMSHNVEEYDIRLQLEDLVSDLLYLQDNYNVTKKER